MARREQHQFLLWVVLLLLASFAFASNASAADLHDPSGSFTGLLDLVKNSAAQWDGKLRGYAKTLFWLLASIQFVWTFMPLVFRQADFGEIVGELIRFILVIGFFYALLLFSAEWADKVVDSFRTAGASAAGLGTSQIRPGDIFGTSIELANTIGDVETWNPLTATMVALAGLLVLLCFAFIAAFMGLTIIESYVVINASVLFMGFGASQWTREYALAIVRYAVSVGAKLFVLTLIVGLIVDSAKTWQAAYNHDDASMWTMVGLALVCAYLAKTIPELVAGMISGTSMGGGSAIGGMAAAGAAGAAAAIATIATAGAAAPAAAGALGAAGSGGAAGAGAAGAGGLGGGGLAAAINSSFAGGSAPAAAATGGGGAASGLGASTGGQAAAKGASSAGARVGGSAAPQSPGPAPQQPSSGVQQAAKQAGKAAQGGDDDKGQQTAAGAQTPPAGNADASASSSAPSASAQSPAAQAGEGQGEAKSGVSGHQIASGVTRGAGILSAIAVPGMEGAVSYTFFQRQAAQVAPKAEGDGPPVATVAAPPVRPDGNDYVPPAGQPQMPTDTAQPVETGGQPTEGQQRAAAPAAPSEAMQRRLRQIQQAEDKRLAKWDEALNGDASVQGFTTKGGQNGGTQQVAMQQAGGNRVNADELMNRYLAANGQAAGMGGMGGGMPGMGGGGMGGNSMAAENQQDRKQAFLAGTPEAEVYLARQRKAAIAPSQEIKAGWVIPGVMISGINSDLPGQIIGQVREAVYDSATGTQCLIPPGSRVVGTYDSGVTLGQQRALAVWRRIIYPDGSSISIDNMPGADMGGYAGFSDKVNNHYLRIFGSGLLLSVFSAGIQLSQPQASNGENYSSSQIIAGSLGQQMGQIGMQMAQRNMNIQPTLEIRPGYEFNIMVTKDIILPTWEGHPMAGSTGKGCN